MTNLLRSMRPIAAVFTGEATGAAWRLVWSLAVAVCLIGQAMAGPYIAKPRPVTRAGWGCDERLRFDSSGGEIWGKEYATWRVVVPHHTATTNNYWDAAAEVRAIYYYHAVTHGWAILAITRSSATTSWRMKAEKARTVRSWRKT